MKRLIVILLAVFIAVMPVSAEENDQTASDVTQTDIYQLAQTYVGIPGDCYQIATRFLREYYGVANVST